MSSYSTCTVPCYQALSPLLIPICDHRVQIYDTDLNLLDFFGTRGSGEGKFRQPYDITADRDGCLYIADCYNHRMQVFTHSGSFLRSFGQYGSGPGELNRPVGILVHNEHDPPHLQLDTECVALQQTGMAIFMCVTKARTVFIFTSLHYDNSFCLTNGKIRGVSFGSVDCYVSHNNNLPFPLQGEQTNLGVLL